MVKRDQRSSVTVISVPLPVLDIITSPHHQNLQQQQRQTKTNWINQQFYLFCGPLKTKHNKHNNTKQKTKQYSTTTTTTAQHFYFYILGFRNTRIAIVGDVVRRGIGEELGGDGGGSVGT